MPQPSGTAVFLGAGASAAFGLPLTNEILPRVIERLGLLHPGETSVFRGDTQAVLIAEFVGAFAALYPGIDLKTATKDELPTITSVLSLVDHLLLSDFPPALRFGREPLTRARRLIERALMEVLIDEDFSPVMAKLAERQDYHPEVKNERLPVQHVRRQAAEDVTLAAFVTWLNDKKTLGPVSIITTNYDLEVETALFKSIGLDNVATAIDFGFDWRDPYEGGLHPRPAPPGISFYKLHGSLNWLRCDLCGQVYINPQEAIAYLSFMEHQVWPNTCHCGWWPLRHLIVAPSMVRDVRNAHLLNVWRSATEALRTARDWFIIGYSLPPEDLAIRSMLLRAFVAQGLESSPRPLKDRAGNPGPAVTVVQRGDGAKATYRALFPQCSYVTGGLDALLDARTP